MHGCETMVRGRAVECELRHPEQGGAYIEGGCCSGYRTEGGGREGGGVKGRASNWMEILLHREKPSRDLTRAFNRLPRALASDFRHFDPLPSPPVREPEDSGGLAACREGIGRGRVNRRRGSWLKGYFLRGERKRGVRYRIVTSNRCSKNRRSFSFFSLSLCFELAHWTDFRIILFFRISFSFVSSMNFTVL